MTPDQLYERIMNIIKMRKEGLLTDQDVSDMIAFNILDYNRVNPYTGCEAAHSA